MPTITTRDQRVGAGPATEKQISFLIRLAGDRVYASLGATADERVRRVQESLETGKLDRLRVSRLIDELLRAPVDAGARATERESLTPGVYEVNGEVFSVKWNKGKTHLYAQRFVERPHIQRLTESGDTVQVELEYAPGVIKTIRPHHKMSLERAKELTIRYGRCLVCGRELKDARSVERGIGPVCRKSFA